MNSLSNELEAADLEIRDCLNLTNPTSFFLLAGAGSGKTRSLTKALEYILEQHKQKLRLNGKRVAVITYTNKACDEIKHRIKFDALIEVTTIHSFAWELIKDFTVDIKIWLERELKEDITDLKSKQNSGRESKASNDRARSIENKEKRLIDLPYVTKFRYNPNGREFGKESLEHSQVIKIAAHFLKDKPLMAQILIAKFPVLFIDECQDTNKDLIDALIKVQEKHPDKFLLGLFGDMMQRIYLDGKADLDSNIPQNWKKPQKLINYRSPKRIISLINTIRFSADGVQQISVENAQEGLVRLFALPSDLQNKQEIEKIIAAKMAQISGDESWLLSENNKTLTLEHKMAARRLGFIDMFEPLYSNYKYKQSLLEDSISELKVFSELVLPILEAKDKNDDFAIAAIVRENSALLNKKLLKLVGINQVEQITKAKDAVNSLFKLWQDNKSLSFMDILLEIFSTELFDLPDSLKSIAKSEKGTRDIQSFMPELFLDMNFDEKFSGMPEEISSLDSLRIFLGTPFIQIKPYKNYILGQAAFDTHQGVKGLEFPRVMVILDDKDAGGFLFSYEKLFGVKEKTKADKENEMTGKETSIDRTKRLFYVICSRAKESLAIVAYSEEPDKLKKSVIERGWFAENEVITYDMLQL